MADAVADILIGPKDHGPRMSLAEFRDAQVQMGYRYELSRGVIEVAPIARLSHGMLIQAIDEQIYAWKSTNPNIIRYYGGGDQAKMELPRFDSERHPDRSLYTTPPPDDEQPWDRWTPTIVIDVVSPGIRNRERDYDEKREEYLAAGVLEYWIVDPDKRAMLALTRTGDTWRENRLGAGGVWTTTLLPGFVLSLTAVIGVLDRPLSG